MAPLRYVAKFDPYLSLDCAPTSSTVAQSKERKGKHGYRSGMPDLLIQIRSSFLEHPIPDPDPVPEAEDLQFQIQIQVQP